MTSLSPTLYGVGKLIDTARRLAVEYHALTGRPLGITGEVGEYEAARLLGLELAPARTAGYDAHDASGHKYQVKTRRILSLNGKIESVGWVDQARSSVGCCAARPARR